MKYARIAAVLAFTALLTACAPVAVTGRVIQGQLSVITSVPQGDARLAQEGIPGVKIVAMQKIQNNRTITAVTDEKGDFRIPLKGDSGLAQNLTFTVEADGYLPAQVDMPTPTPQQRLLVVLKPLRTSSE